MNVEVISILLLTPAKDFIASLPFSAAEKIRYNLHRVACGRYDKDLFKKLSKNIWEFRTLYEGVAYRLLAFYDPSKKALIVATNGFIKKTGKTPLRELARAETLRKIYLEV